MEHLIEYEQIEIMISIKFLVAWWPLPPRLGSPTRESVNVFNYVATSCIYPQIFCSANTHT